MNQGTQILKPPEQKKPERPTVQMIQGYLEALEASAQEVLNTEFPYDTDPDRIDSIIITEVQGIQKV